MTVELTMVFVDPTDPDECGRRSVHPETTGTGGVDILLAEVESA